MSPGIHGPRPPALPPTASYGMRRSVQSDLVELLTIPVSLLVLFAVGGTAFFLGAGIQDGMKGEASCSRPWSRGEYVYPWYRLGCWLGETP